MTVSAIAVSAGRSDRAVRFWLIAIAVMTLLMVVIGGVTRLTESGLSITEWQPVSGAVPPLSDAAWQAAFEGYKQIPQFAEHPDMTLADFKAIFFWEYLHRLWGRLIGLVAILPPLLFLAQGRLRRDEALKYLAVPVLVGLQGVLGWYMVKSGLSIRTSVSQYRLTAHLALAVLIYGYVVWLAADRYAADRPQHSRIAASPLLPWARLVLGLVLLTLLAGGFMAGLRAGLLYETFPLMNGQLVPDGYFFVQPWWLNPFENATAVNFDHRWLAITTFCAVIGLWLASRRTKLSDSARMPINLMFAMAVIQVALGISTLLLSVPIPLAAAHQAGAILLFTFALLAVHGLSSAR